MNILVLNGSPSGQRGISAHYTAYLEQQLPEHRFEVVEVARKIRKIERERARFDAIVDQMVAADVIIWCFPVYFMLVSAQLKRFIELLFDRVGSTALTGKLTTALSTSAHFYDHTAHDYLAGVCSDLGMDFVQGFTAGSDDLLTEAGRDNLMGFARELLHYAGGQRPPHAGFPPIERAARAYDPPLPEPQAKTGSHPIVLITDAGPDDQSLQRMIDVFDRCVAHPVDRLDLNELRMDGGCLGCMGCADDGVCRYRDDYAAAFDQRVRPASVVLYAGSVRDRYLSARHKMFLDRFFSNGHRPVLAGKLAGFLVSGPLHQLATLRETLEAHIQIGGCQRLGIVTDDHPDPETTTHHLQSLARSVTRWLDAPWFHPPSFLGVGGHKVFRDLIYQNKGALSADHRYYRAAGLYDFPQSDLGQRMVMRLMLTGKRLPLLRKRMKRVLRDGHTRRFRQLLADS